MAGIQVLTKEERDESRHAEKGIRIEASGRVPGSGGGEERAEAGHPGRAGFRQEEAPLRAHPLPARVGLRAAADAKSVFLPC